jgi:hypothetical protein
MAAIYSRNPRPPKQRDPNKKEPWWGLFSLSPTSCCCMLTTGGKTPFSMLSWDSEVGDTKSLRWNSKVVAGFQGSDFGFQGSDCGFSGSDCGFLKDWIGLLVGYGLRTGWLHRIG